MTLLNEQLILQAWNHNASPWIEALESREIASRELVTNRAILEAVPDIPSVNVLDLGCGEGWLSRALNELGREVIGVDAVPMFLETAKAKGGGDFKLCRYEHICRRTVGTTVDLAVANFSLLGRQSVELAFRRLRPLLNYGGHFVVQTLHPHVTCGDHAYKDGWREGSWAGVSERFKEAAPWYFRTLESWLKLFSDTGYSLTQIKEPINPETNKPASVIFIAQKVDL